MKVYCQIQIVLILFVVLLSCAGCKSERQEISIKKETYTKMESPYTKVQVGDLSPCIQLSLEGSGHREYRYRAAASGLQIKKIHVRVGDRVKKGDILISFRSDEVDEQKSTYKKQLREDKLLMEHDKKLAQIDSSHNYREEIEDLEKEMNIARLYLREAKKRNRLYQLRAKADGTITFMNKDIVLSDFRSDTRKILLKSESGSESFTAETTEEYPFKLGHEYRADCGNSGETVGMKLIKVVEPAGEKKGANIKKSKKNNRQNNKQKRTLYFRAMSEIVAKEATALTISLKKKKLRHVVYVDSEAVCHVGDQNFVYVIDERGYQDVAEVSVGEEVEGCTVIQKGLQGGEKLALSSGK